jgi:hypothetical protein
MATALRRRQRTMLSLDAARDGDDDGSVSMIARSLR